MTASPITPGLCADCRHRRDLENRRGSVFVLCDLAANDPALRRYPQLPVLDCHGYDPLSSTASTNTAPPPGKPR